MERQALFERTRQGVQAYPERGGTFGRKVGKVETRKKILSKPKKIVSFLNKGKTYQDI